MEDCEFAMSISSSLDAEEDFEKESDPLVSAVSGYFERVEKKSFWSWQPNSWTATTFLLAGLLFGVWIGDFLFKGKHNSIAPFTYESGFETDWIPAREAIKIKRVQFYGGLYFDSNRTLVATKNPEEPLYVGPPSQEMDDAWEDLVHGRYLTVSYEEAKQVSETVFFDKNRGGYSVGIDSLHSLHCLNVIRMVQDFDHYISKGMRSEELSRLHVDHCINHIRQIIQCHGDLTPLPMVWVDIGDGWTVPEFDREHTCRDFSTLREWSTRKQESGWEKAQEKLQAS